MKRPRCSSCGIIIERGKEGFGGWVWTEVEDKPWVKIEVCGECTPRAVVDLATDIGTRRPKRQKQARRETKVGLARRQSRRLNQ